MDFGDLTMVFLSVNRLFINNLFQLNVYKYRGRAREIQLNKIILASRSPQLEAAGGYMNKCSQKLQGQ